MGNIYFGGTKQEIPMLFDTGSPMVYVLTNECRQELCPQKTKLDQYASWTFKLDSDGIKDELAHCYGKGCVNGHVAKDSICLTKDGDMNQCITA